MTFEEIKQSDKLFLSAIDVADVLETCPQTLRKQAEIDVRQLGFNCTRLGNRTLIPRKPFIYFIEGV